MKKLFFLLALAFITACSKPRVDEFNKLVEEVGAPNLNWEDFEVFGTPEKLESELYILRYDLGNSNYLVVGGIGEYQKPYNISLFDEEGNQTTIKDFASLEKITEEEANTFIKENMEHVKKYVNLREEENKDGVFFEGTISAKNVVGKDTQVFFPYYSNDKFIGYLNVYKSQGKLWYEYVINNFPNFSSDYLNTDDDKASDYYANVNYNVNKELFELVKNGTIKEIK